MDLASIQAAVYAVLDASDDVRIDVVVGDKRNYTSDRKAADFSSWTIKIIDTSNRVCCYDAAQIKAVVATIPEPKSDHVLALEQTGVAPPRRFGKVEIYL